jgi:hypothetical protein
MKITTYELKEIMIEVATHEFGTSTFRRRPFMRAVETRLKQTGAWTPDDNSESGSAGKKSAGMALIDYRISDLKRGSQSGSHLNI